MKHLLLGIVLIVIGVGLVGARYARSSITTRRDSAAVSTEAPPALWILPVLGVVLIVLGILFAVRVF